MTLQRAMIRPAALAAALLVAGAAGAAAQQRPLFEWRGRVDSEVRLVMRGRSLNAQFASWKDRSRDRTRVFNVLPNEDGIVVARVTDGRGYATVVQQPNSRNGYTAVIRIEDPRSGADNYSVQTFWQPVRNGWGNDNGWNRGRDNRDDRGRDDDGRWNNGGWNNDGRNNGGWNNGAWNSRGDYHFSGSVDDELQIRIQGRNVQFRNVRGERIRDVQQNLSGALPNGPVNVRVQRHNGRGNVDVIQQPAAWNGYTAVVRVRDRAAGADYYDFDLTW